MELEQEKLNYDIAANKYRITYRCPNCGFIFEKDLSKGVPALGNAGECPYCGVQDQKPNIGNFKVLKLNEILDCIPSGSQTPHPGW